MIANAGLRLLVTCCDGCRHDYNSIPSAVASEARAAAAVAQLDALSTAAAEARHRPAAPAAAKQAPQKEPIHPAVAARVDHIQNFAGQQEGPFRVCTGSHYVLLYVHSSVLSCNPCSRPLCHQQAWSSCPSKVTVKFEKQADDEGRALYWPGEGVEGWQMEPLAVCRLQTWLCLERVASILFHKWLLTGPSTSLRTSAQADRKAPGSVGLRGL